MRTYAVVCLGSAVLTLLLTPVVSRIARALGLVDVPDARKVHRAPVPRIGGIVFVVSVLCWVIPTFFLNNPIGQAVRNMRPQLVTLLISGVFVFLVGLIDDVRSMPAMAKLICLLAAGLAVCLSGARVETITVENLFTIRFGWTSWPVTLLWIVGVTVGINFIDGLDGLAAGISAIVCGTIAVFAFYRGQAPMVVLSVALLGSLVGFLLFNFNPAMIFMGDGGSLFIGFLLGAGSVVCQAKTTTLVGIAIPALALGVPILDAALTMIRRTVLDRRSVFSAERGHIHHRLLDKGLRHRTAVIVIYAVTMAVAGMGLLMLSVRRGAQVALLAGGVLLLFIVFQLAGSLRLKEIRTAMQQAMAVGRQRKKERDCFEDAQLKLRQAGSLDAWWSAMCCFVEEMDFERLALSWREGEADTKTMVWRRSPEPLSPDDVINITLRVNHSPVGDKSMEIAVRPNGSLEIAGRRVMLIGRLLDERVTPALPPRRRRRQRADKGGQSRSATAAVEGHESHLVVTNNDSDERSQA